MNYTYDGDGKRVEKSSGTLYWYGMASDPLEETNLTGGWLRDYVFFNGQRIAARTPSAAVLAFFDNHLGSTSKLESISSSGSVTQAFDADYYPFGRAHQFTDSYDPGFKFEGKERDEESGLDNFGARYYTSNIGRFMSADWSAVPIAVPYANLTNPQTLNLYAMVSDNPETFADLDGHLSGNEGQCWVDFCGGNVSLDMGPNQALEGEGFAPPPPRTGDGQPLSDSQQEVTANEQSDQQNRAQAQNQIEDQPNQYQQQSTDQSKQNPDKTQNQPATAMIPGKQAPGSDPAANATKQKTFRPQEQTKPELREVNRPAPKLPGEKPIEEYTTFERVTLIITRLGHIIGALGGRLTAPFVVRLPCNSGPGSPPCQD